MKKLVSKTEALEKPNHSEDSDELYWKTFYFDGSGGVAGQGSGWAWIYTNTDKRWVEWVDGLTSNEAEYAGFIDVLSYVAPDSNVRIYSDSQLVVRQFNGQYAASNPRMHRLLAQAKEIIERKNLNVDLQWLRRDKNLAGVLLDAEKEFSEPLEPQRNHAAAKGERHRY